MRRLDSRADFLAAGYQAEILEFPDGRANRVPACAVLLAQLQLGWQQGTDGKAASAIPSARSRATWAQRVSAIDTLLFADVKFGLFYVRT